jgi:hypothetical protein
MRLLLACAPMVALFLVGCGNDPYAGRHEVSGKAQLNGQPIKDGFLAFEPLDNQDTKGSSQILEGSYRIPREVGLKPGRYRIRITAGDGKTPAREEAGQPGGSTNIVSKDLIPHEWGALSDKEVTVKTEGPNTFDFDVK